MAQEKLPYSFIDDPLMKTMLSTFERALQFLIKIVITYEVCFPIVKKHKNKLKTYLEASRSMHV